MQIICQFHEFEHLLSFDFIIPIIAYYNVFNLYKHQNSDLTPLVPTDSHSRQLKKWRFYTYLYINNVYIFLLWHLSLYNLRVDTSVACDILRPIIYFQYKTISIRYCIIILLLNSTGVCLWSKKTKNLIIIFYNMVI
jgi:hypothetical protein